MPIRLVPVTGGEGGNCADGELDQHQSGSDSHANEDVAHCEGIVPPKLDQQTEESYVATIGVLLDMLNAANREHLEAMLRVQALEKGIDLLAEICAAQSAVLRNRGVDTALPIVDDRATLWS